jgi:predicted P-loop ATPase
LKAGGNGKYDIKAIKALVSQVSVNERLPMPKNQHYYIEPVRSSKSTNEAEFLIDNTGSVRWIIFECNSKNKFFIVKFNVDDFWSQAYHILKMKKFKSELSKEEI